MLKKGKSCEKKYNKCWLHRNVKDKETLSIKFQLWRLKLSSYHSAFYDLYDYYYYYCIFLLSFFVLVLILGEKKQRHDSGK